MLVGRSLRVAILASTFLSGGALAQDLPTGGNVVAGQAGVSSNGTTTTVTQSTDRAVVNWNSFDVGAGRGVVFAQPGSGSATLNRVTGASGSTIAGSITSNGAVFLVNPNGIAITSTGSVQTGGGFVASTLDIADADFMGGKLAFAGSGGSVSNAGVISAGSGAYVALLGGEVSNSGFIVVPAGRVALGAGTRMTLDVNGDGFLQVAAPASVTGAVADASGRVQLGVSSVREALRAVVNMPGDEVAVTAVPVGGGIALGGAVAPAPTRISMTGAIITDSATGDGGRIELIGDANSQVSASGWLVSRAIGATGNGGFVETSGASVDFTGLKVDTTSLAGRVGTWLIDPTNLTVDAAAASTISSSLATNNVTLQTTSTTASGPGNQSAGNGDITVNSGITWTSGNTLSLLAYNNITLNAGITGTAGTLTLTAGNGFANTGVIRSAYSYINTPGGGAVNVGVFNLTNGAWGQTGPTLAAFSATDFRFNPANATFLRVTGGAGTSASPYTIADVYGLQGMASSTLLTNSFALAGNIDASGTAKWNTGAGFVAIGTDGAGNALNSGSGFTGSLAGGNATLSGLTINRPGVQYQGLFGYAAGAAAISNLTLTGVNLTTGQSSGGLLGNVGFGATVTITNAKVSGTLAGTSNIGGLVGYLSSSSISGSSAAVTVSGSAAVGGLLGGTYSSATVTNSFATGNVTGTGGVGGLIGVLQNLTTISGVYATGNVTGAGKNVGGLIGSQFGGWLTGGWASGNVTNTASPANAGGTGGLIGDAEGTVANVYATGNVTAASNLGGLIGNQGAGSLTRGWASGNVTGTMYNVGGLLGYQSNTTATSVYATGNVTAGADYAGGLVGSQYNSSLSNAYATGNVQSAGDAAGGVVGYRNTDTSYAIPNSVYWDTFSTGQANAVGLSFRQGPVNAVAVTSDPAQSGATNYAFKTSAYANFTQSNWVFFDGQTRPFLAFEQVAPGGTIFNSHQLQLINLTGTSLAGSYTLGGNIDLSETGRVVAGTPGSYLGMWASTGWVPIGTDGKGTVASSGFTGSLDGRNNTVSGLTINRPGVQLGGLFGSTSGASVSNITLAAVNVLAADNSGALIGSASNTTVSNASGAGTITGNGQSIGGLLGAFNGTLTNSSSSATVTNAGTNTNNRFNTGGLAGYFSGNATSVSATGNVTSSSDALGGLFGSAAGSIIKAYATGAVSNQAMAQYTGGLVGVSTATITNAYATGAVSGGTGYDTGGLVGRESSGSISNAYATGSVSGKYYVGGLVGIRYTASISNSYAAGQVTGSSSGGLLGYSFSNTGTVTNSYWDSYSTGQAQASGGGQAVDSSVAAVTSDPASSAAANYAFKRSAYPAFSTTDWVFVPGLRPIGAWEAAPSVNGVQTVANAHQFAIIGANASTLAGTYTLGGNLDLSSMANFVPIGTDGSGGVWNGSAFTATGTVGFSGVFDGGGYTIKGPVVNNPNATNVGLFGFTSGTIKNVTITGGNVTGGTNVGGLTGYLYGGMITNVSVNGSVSATNNAGGIAGIVYKGTITNSTSSGSVGSSLNAGGIAGFQQSSTITNSSSSASANATKAYAGGLVGYQLNGNTNSNVSASGNVSAPSGAGGLVGIAVGYPYAGDTSTTSVITNAFATGTVTGTSGTGGLIGFLGYGASVSQSYATGAVNGVTNVGGLIGYQYIATVADSYATGAVHGTTNVGGLIGVLDGSTASVARSYATGAVSGGTALTGGLVANLINGASVTASVWDIQTTGQATSAGGPGAVGYPTSQLQDATTTAVVYPGWDFTNVWLQPNQAGQNGIGTAHYPRLRARPTP